MKKVHVHNFPICWYLPVSHSVNEPTTLRGFTLCSFSETYLRCYSTENQSEKQVCDSNVIFLAKTSPPAVIWWEWARLVVWSMTGRCLKEKLRRRPSRMGLDFLTAALASSPILISLDPVRETGVSNGSLYRARCQIPQSFDMKLISQWDVSPLSNRELKWPWCAPPEQG